MIAPLQVGHFVLRAENAVPRARIARHTHEISRPISRTKGDRAAAEKPWRHAMNDQSDMPLTTAHWGTYRVEMQEGRVAALHGFEEDVDPSPIGNGIVDVLDGPTRITAPMVRKSWLDNGPGSNTDKRGSDPFVEVSWDVAEKLVADELNRVRTDFGNESIFAGSYGWASAGRFHHAQSQLKRFLNCMGGFTKSVNSYSLAAGEVIFDRAVGDFRGFLFDQTSWQSIVGDTELFVCFGGIPLKNGQISQGGLGRHRQREAMHQANAAGIQFVNISPLRSDVLDDVKAEWLPARPSTDAAILLGLAHTLLTENLHDQDFLDTYTVGFDKYCAYLRGETDGVEKSADWASEISELPADAIRSLARRMAASRTMISASWSLTRQDHGEQPFWGVIALAAMIGQIGLPGGGFGLGYSAVNTVGLESRRMKYKSLPQGQNGVDTFIPVARISDLLLNPGGKFDYDGTSYTYPDTRIVYWAGGNPFHHHQDLNRMVRAWQKPDTIIVHEWCWNALAKHADIVLPCTTALERNDLTLAPRDPYIVYMKQAIPPVGLARDDFDILRGISSKMGLEDAFTEGRDSEDWQRWIYDLSRQSAAESKVELPSLDQLREDGWVKVDAPEEPMIMLQGFRSDPQANRLKTPSGKIEIYSETIAGFNYDDCLPHPAWLEPVEWLGIKNPPYPLHMISNQPTTKLHSQLDHGQVSRAAKIKGREPVMLNPEDAAARNISDGDIVRVFNDRGACLCGAIISDTVRPRVIQLSTGAWYDPTPDGSLCKHGNPNVLTMDKGTSSLAQGPIAHSCLVDVEVFVGDLPPLTAFTPPEIIRKDT